MKKFYVHMLLAVCVISAKMRAGDAPIFNFDTAVIKQGLENDKQNAYWLINDKETVVADYLAMFIADRASAKYAPMSKLINLAADQLPSYITHSKIACYMPSKETLEGVATKGAVGALLAVMRLVTDKNTDVPKLVATLTGMRAIGESMLEHGAKCAAASMLAVVLNTIFNATVTSVAKHAHLTKWLEAAQSNPEVNSAALALVAGYIKTHQWPIIIS